MTAIRSRTRAVTLAVVVAVSFLASIGAAACGSSDDGGDLMTDASATPTPDLRDAAPIERLIAAYGDPTVDPSRQAWEALLADPGFETQAVAVVEFVRLRDGDASRDAYDAFLDALTPAITSSGGQVVSINDIWRPGLEGLDGYEGGVSWIATVPSMKAYVDALLDPGVVAQAGDRREAVSEAQILLGPNLLPDVILQLPPNDNAADFPSQRVAGKTTDEIVAELLTVYPDGGADPTEETLRAMVEWDSFERQRVHFINLYRFNDDPGGGQTALSEYNAAAFPVVVAHGGRPKVLVNVTHHLAGPVRWDRFIFVSWPSLAVFTDLRLDPAYIEAQRDRVVSADVYGNLITVARADQAAAE
jgi:uncharacterized protein (DUF1330 family)